MSPLMMDTWHLTWETPPPKLYLHLVLHSLYPDSITSHIPRACWRAPLRVAGTGAAWLLSPAACCRAVPQPCSPHAAHPARVPVQIPVLTRSWFQHRAGARALP